MIDEITSLSDIATLQQQTRLSGHIFRGQSNYAWQLSATIQRDDNRRTLANELQLYGQFRQALQRRSLPIRSTLPQAAGQWLALMQHYNIATRLLDWTKNILVGLRFASEANMESDGALYVLNPFQVFQSVSPVLKEIPSMFVGPETTPYFNFPEDRYLWFQTSEGQPVVAPISPIEPNEREQIQEGIFTVSNDLSQPQDEIIKRYVQSDNDLVKIRIHKAIKNDIVQMLEAQHGLTRDYLMSPIGSIANDVRALYL